MPVNTTTIVTIDPTIHEVDDHINSSNDSFARIVDIITLINSIETDVYGVNTLASLTTSDNTSIIGAINSLHTEFLSGALIFSVTGALASLITSNKTTLVDAINELDGDVGDLSTLTTINTSSIVGVVNELNSSVGIVGTIGSLLIVDKSSIVAAINEIYS